MLAVPGAEIHRSRLAAALSAAQPGEHLREGPVAMARSQQPDRIAGGSLAAVQFEDAAWPIRQAVMWKERRRVHAGILPYEQIKNKPCQLHGPEQIAT